MVESKPSFRAKSSKACASLSILAWVILGLTLNLFDLGRCFLLSPSPSGPAAVPKHRVAEGDDNKNGGILEDAVNDDCFREDE